MNRYEHILRYFLGILMVLHILKRQVVHQVFMFMIYCFEVQNGIDMKPLN